MIPLLHRSITRNKVATGAIRMLCSTGKCAQTHVEQKIEIDGKTINYVQVSGGGGVTSSAASNTTTKPRPAVLLMPGALGSAWTDFRPQIEQLPQLLPNHTIIAWDPPGYGKSTPPQRQFSLDFFEQDANVAHNLMTALGHGGRYAACGWSDGGITAMILAALFPRNIEKLVIWGSNSYVLPKELEIYESKNGAWWRH